MKKSDDDVMAAIGCSQLLKNLCEKARKKCMGEGMVIKKDTVFACKSAN